MVLRTITFTSDFTMKLQQVQNVLGFQAAAALAGIDSRTYVRSGICHDTQRNRINCAHAIMLDMICELKQSDQMVRAWFNSLCVVASTVEYTPIQAIAHDLTAETHEAFDAHYRASLMPTSS